MGNYNPKLPTKYTGTNKYITFFVSRNRSPTGADYRQPETGTLYSVGTVWQVSKNPTTGTEGDLWMLSKIVANVGYWIKISSGVTPSGALLSLSDTANTLVFPNVSGNIQLQGTTGQIDILSVPGSNKLIFSLSGSSAAIEHLTGNSGGQLNPDGSNNFNILGTGSLTVVGSGSTLTPQLTGLTNHALLVGAGTATITKLAVGATGTVLAGVTGADPVFTATPAVTSITLSGGTPLDTYTANVAWTPTLVGGTVAGATTYVTQTATYTLIGNIVVCQCVLQISAATGTGDVLIGGFPFNFTGLPSAATQWGGAGWTWPVGSTTVSLEGVSGTNHCIVKCSGSTINAANMQMANASLSVAFTIAYLK